MAKIFKNNLGVILVAVLAMIPLIIWVFMLPIAGRFSSSGQTLRSLGQVTGLSGMALLSINFILSARFNFLDRWFNGLNRVYLKHHIVGALSFGLLLFHPTFLAVQYLLISLPAAFSFIFSLEGWPLNLGKLALLIFIALMVITFYMHFKYQNWKNTHKYLGLVLFLGGLHMLFIPSDIVNNAILKYYMLGLSVLGAYSYCYHTIFGAYKKHEYKYELLEIVRINNNVVELKLKPLAGKIKFIPGQFVFLRFDMDGALSESHPFSVTSCSHDEYLSLGIKVLGDYTAMIYTLKPGAICRIEGPFGAFSYLKAKSRRQIWIAGGIGITPFLSMAREINVSKDNNYQIDLYYSVKNEAEAAFFGELEQMAKQNPNFKFHQHFSEKEGYISAKTAVNDRNDVSDTEVFLCGPGGFMQSLRRQFVASGFNNNKIHSEEFNLSN